MDTVVIILGVVFSYFVFVSLAVVLAKMIFPKIELEEDDFLSKDLLIRKKSRKTKEKQFSLDSVGKERVGSSYRVTLSHK